MAKQEVITKEFETVMKLIRKKGIKIIYVEEGQKINIDNDCYLNILYIGKDTQNLNNNSVIAKLEYKNFKVLFTGDAEKEEELDLLKTKLDLKANILKVGHHGSATSSTQEFVTKVNPDVALIGVGKKNKFGHPDDEVIKRFEKNGIKIYRTDKCGEITIKVQKDGNIVYSFQTQSE